MESSFGNCAKLLWPETQKILAQRPKVRKVLFLPEIFPLECSTGRVECLTDEPGAFLQIRSSSEKPSKDIKLCLLPKNVSPKRSSGHVDFVFDTLVENFGHRSWTSSFKIRKECQIYLFSQKKTIFSKSFSLQNIWNAVLATPLKVFCHETSTFSLTAHKSKIYRSCQIFSPELLGSTGHVECLPGSCSFYFEVVADS